jgi:hypothetical protein
MIVVTGPGRSGTSLVARTYEELGFDPGGHWYEELHAGREAEEIVLLNQDIMGALGVGVLIRRLPGWVRGTFRALPAPLRGAVRARWQVLPEWIGRDAHVRWDRLDEVVRQHRPRIREVAASQAVAKDPRFCWTLRVWALAGAPIEHVLLAVRDLEAVVDSRIEVGHLVPGSRTRAKNALAYALGLCVSALHEHRIPYDIVRFPDFLNDPGALFEAMRFPRPVPRRRFEETFRRLARPELVHHGPPERRR